MDIAEVSKASGLPASTLRFYEEKGIIQSNGRNGLRRLFSASVIERLALISLGRKVGFSLDEISEMFTPEGPDINRALLLAKAEELDRKITELTAMRNGLRHAAACKAPSHFECPKFLRLLRVAGKNRSRQPNKLMERKVKRGVRKASGK
jgi:DNA-binding transcriptional MerR regulator